MTFFNNLHRGLEENGMRLDAGQSSLMEKSLTALLAGIQETVYSEAIAQQILPVAAALGTGLTSIEFYRGVPTGEMQLIGATANDLPRIDESLVKTERPVANYGASFGWSLIEFERAQRQNFSFEQRRAMQARQIAERHIDAIVFGESDPNRSDIKGLFGDALSAASGLTGGWATATETQILDDVQLILDAGYQGSGGEVIPDSLILPSEEYGLLKYKMRANTDSNLLEIVQNKLGVSVYRSARLNSVTSATNSLSAAPTAVAFKRDPMIVELQIPRPFQLRPGQWRGLEYCVDFLLDFSGVFNYLPSSFGLGDLS